MRTVTFNRGVHPNDAKLTSGEQTKIITPKAGWEMIFPMSQHIGAPCEPLVAKGDTVRAGQRIGESKAFVSAPIHSSVSGVVKEIRATLTPSGQTCPAVVIENDGKNTEHGVAKAREANRDAETPAYERMGRDQILALIKDAGVVGLGGAGFPTHVKLNPPPDKKIDYIIVNGAECEPYLTTDHRVMLEETEKLIEGLKIVLSLHPGAQGVIGVETNKPDAIEKLEQAVAGTDIEVVSLLKKYPQGAEKQLIYAVCEREVPSGGLPADIGCIVNNVDTIVSIWRAVMEGTPLTRRIVTVTGDAVQNPGNYEVRLGMSFRQLMDEIGGFRAEPYKLISGGPMMGIAMFSLDVPIVKTSAALLALTKKSARLPKQRNCIRCGKCVEICPMGLMPQQLDLFVIDGDMEQFRKYNGADCIECGSCSYVCPAARYLTQSIRLGRREVLKKR